MKVVFLPLVTLAVIVSLVTLFACTKTNNSNSNPPNSSKRDWLKLGDSSTFTNGSSIYDVVADQAGNIYVSGAKPHEIAMWNGRSWQTLGDINISPFSGGVYWPIAIDGSGNVYATGLINVPLANAEIHVAKWVKSSGLWVNLTNGHPICDNGIRCIVADASGNIYVSANNILGHNSSIGNGSFIMKWNGSNWSEVGSTLPSGDNVYLTIDASGNLYANPGYNSNASTYMAIWTGTAWQELGGTNASDFGTGQIKSMCTDPSGNVYAAGYFVKNNKSYNVVEWNKNNNSLSFLSTGIFHALFAYSIISDMNGTIFTGGDFTDSSGVRFVAKWNGSSWAKVGNLIPNGAIRALCVDNTGKVYAGGDFTDSSGHIFVSYHDK